MQLAPATAALCLWLATALPAAAQEFVTLAVAPSTTVDMTYTVNTLLGSDSAGPKAVAVTGGAVAQLGLAQDPTHGLFADFLRFTSSNLDFADTTFTTAVRFPITTSFEGIAGELGTALLSPGTPIAAGESEFDQAQLTLAWTEGMTVVDLTGESTPVAGMVFDPSGSARISTQPGSGAVDVVVTLPLEASAGRSFPNFSSDEVTLVGDIVLVGSFTPSAVPATGSGWRALLLGIVCISGLAAPLAPGWRRGFHPRGTGSALPGDSERSTLGLPATTKRERRPSR